MDVLMMKLVVEFMECVIVCNLWKWIDEYWRNLVGFLGNGIFVCFVEWICRNWGERKDCIFWWSLFWKLWLWWFLLCIGFLFYCGVFFLFCLFCLFFFWLWRVCSGLDFSLMVIVIVLVLCCFGVLRVFVFVLGMFCFFFLIGFFLFLGLGFIYIVFCKFYVLGFVGMW